jgi:hypothetical protein
MNLSVFQLLMLRKHIQRGVPPTIERSHVKSPLRCEPGRRATLPGGEPELDAQLDHRSSAAALVRWRLRNRLHVRMLL